MTKGDLSQFAWRGVGKLDADMWRAYYSRQFFRLFRLLLLLTKKQLGYSWLATVRLAYHSARAALDHRRHQHSSAKNKRILADLTMFYKIISERGTRPFDYAKAAELEIAWWQFDRSSQKDRAKIEQGMAAAAAVVHSVDGNYPLTSCNLWNKLERTLGVTYKTAWRIAKLIRSLMQQGGNPLSGVVEIDETYIGGKHKRKGMLDNKTAVIGMVEKKKNTGQAAAVATKRADASVALPFIRAMAKQGSEIQTDESRIYHRVKREYAHRFVNHSKEEYSKDGISTNTIEGFWSQMKRSIDGTYHCVSPKYLQNYVNEFVFRYNLRAEPVFPALVAQASQRVR